MKFDIFVEPHERCDALDAYGDFLTVDQHDQIEHANEKLRFRLTLDYSKKTAVVVPV